MEEGLPYKVEVFYDNYCIRCSNNKVLFVTKGDMINYNGLKIIIVYIIL